MYNGEDRFYKNYLLFKHGTPEEKEKAIKWFNEVEHTDIVKLQNELDEKWKDD